MYCCQYGVGCMFPMAFQTLKWVYGPYTILGLQPNMVCGPNFMAGPCDSGGVCSTGPYFEHGM